MNLLVVSVVDIHNSPPNRIHLLLRHLKRDHTVTVCCLHDPSRSRPGTAAMYYRGSPDLLDGLEVRYMTRHRFPLWIQELLSPGPARNNSGEQFDLILNYNTLWSGYRISRITSLPMVLDIADDLPAMIGTSPRIPRMLQGPGRWLGEQMIKKSIRQAVRVTAPSAALGDRFAVPREKFTLVPNGVDTGLFRPMDRSERENLPLGNAFVLGYAGVLREWVDLDPVFQALRDLRDVRLVIIGDEGSFDRVRTSAAAHGVDDRVVFTGPVPHAELPAYLAAMDACLIPFVKNETAHHAVPLKLFEYCACGKPVISTRLEGVRAVAGDRIFYADTPAEIVQRVGEIRGRDLTRQMEENRQFVAGQYDWSAIAAGLNAVLEGIA